MPKEPKELFKVKTIQTRILKRFLSKKDLKKFLDEYRAHKRGWGSRDRFWELAKPFTKAQKGNLWIYLFDESGKSISMLAKERGQSYNQFMNDVRMGSLRVLFNNKDKLNLKKLLGGE